jgi:hypothetical protein
MVDFFVRGGLMPSVSDERRQFPRRYLRETAVCELAQSLPAIERARTFAKVYLKDVSRGGISFLAPQQLYPCEELQLWTNSGKHACRVIRCTKHNDRCYEIGTRIL